jgi:chromosome partitioning protein
MIGQVTLDSVIVETALPYLHMVPSNQDLIGMEVEFVHLEDREVRLRKLLQSMNGSYDFIIIDCPPSLGFMTVNALVAAHALIVPLQCEYYALEGLSYLLNTVKLVKANLNPELSLDGILLTMFDARNSLAHRVAEDVRKHLGNKVLKTIIPRNVRLSESPSHGLPIILYDVKSRGAFAYMALAEEILRRGM